MLARGVAGVSSALAEHLGGGRYLDIDIDRAAAGRAGMSISDLQAIVWREIGGEAMARCWRPGLASKAAPSTRSTCAAPMLGGMASAPLLDLLVAPAVWWRRQG